MRITGGIYRGRQVLCPKGLIRPAMSKMRESMFSIIGDLSGCSFLDLFSGSGLVGIEAASRGADPVVLVESDKRKAPVIRRNISIVESGMKLVLVPVERYLRSSKESFDLVYVDPPFSWKGKRDLLLKIDNRKLVNSSGTLIIHHPKNDDPGDNIGEMHLHDRRQYGQSILTFYAYK